MDKTRPDPAACTQEADLARQILRAEAAAIQGIAIGREFHQAVELILQATGGPIAAPDPEIPRHAQRRSPPPPCGAVVVSGLGKSGLVGQKLSATFASTGTPSHFLHPTEALHGDLGRIRQGDVVLVLSFGGTTDEVVALATILRQDGVPVIAMVGRAQSDLARLATIALCIGEVEEAGPLSAAPTASSVAMMALGDALALCAAQRRNFGIEDFRKRHPGGALGRQLMPAAQAMRFRVGQNLPLIRPEATVEQAYAQADSATSHLRRAGALLIVDDAGRLAGIFTDGDLRRMFIRHGSAAWRDPIGQHMTRNPRKLPDTALVRDAVQLMRELRIDEIPIVDADHKPLGLIDVQDLVALKVIEG